MKRRAGFGYWKATGMNDQYISFSDVEAFLRCRQMWDFKSANRQSIRHKVTPKLYLSIGSAFHKGIEAGIRGEEDPVAVTEAYMAEERVARAKAYEEEYGFKPWANELEAFDEAADTVRDLVAQYFRHYGTTNPLVDQGLTYLGVEIPFKINVSSLFGWDLFEQNVYFVGTIDAIAVDEQGRIFLVENKTFTAKPSVEDIQWNYQIQGYAKAFQWLTGMPVTGVLYNGVAKKLIQEPRILQNGALSTDARQATTWALYTSAMTAKGLSLEDPKYAKILASLAEKERQGDDRFFYRELVFFQDEQIISWTRDFTLTVGEMIDEPTIYRTIPFKGCGDCWFSDLCHSKHSGGDVDYILDARYTVGSYGTIDEVRGIEPTTITSVDELKEFLANV